MGEVQKRRHLTNLIIRETSGVDHPANAPQVGADGWIVCKSDGSGLTPDEIEQLTRARGDRLAAQRQKADASMKGQTVQVADDHPTHGGKTGVVIGHDQAAGKATVAFGSDGTKTFPTDQLTVKKSAQGGTTVPDDTPTADELAKQLEETRAELAKARDEIAELKKAAESTAPVDDDSVALQKALDEMPAPLRKAWEDQQNRLAAAEAVAKAARDEQLTMQAIQKAAEFAPIAKAEEFGPVLRNAQERMDAEPFAELERVLRAASEQLKANRIFKTVGSGADGTTGDASVMPEIEAKADELRKADPKLTKEQAVEKATIENPDLARRYADEMARKAG